MMQFSYVADVLSVIGFFITIYVALRVRTLRREYLLLGRLPEQASRLQDEADELVALLSETANNQQEILDALANIEVRLRSVRSSLSGDLLQDSNRLYNHVRRLRGLPVRFRWFRSNALGTRVQNFSEHELRAVYTEITKLVSNVYEDRENQNWTR